MGFAQKNGKRRWSNVAHCFLLHISCGTSVYRTLLYYADEIAIWMAPLGKVLNPVYSRSYVSSSGNMRLCPAHTLDSSVSIWSTVPCCLLLHFCCSTSIYRTLPCHTDEIKIWMTGMTTFGKARACPVRLVSRRYICAQCNSTHKMDHCSRTGNGSSYTTLLCT